MKGQHAFCPESGASLSRERDYATPDPDGVVRPGYAEAHSTSSDVDAGGGLVTNGERVSSTRGLIGRFRHCYAEHVDGDPDARVERAAATALRKLKSARDRAEWDIWVWTALQERLERAGVDADWMTEHVELRCPSCAGPLAWERAPRGDRLPRCAQDCDDRGIYRHTEIADRVRALYTQAFETEITDVHVLP